MPPTGARRASRESLMPTDRFAHRRSLMQWLA
jgi:hypothetical protein